MSNAAKTQPMTAPKHTPGPWYVNGRNVASDYAGQRGGNRLVAECGMSTYREIDEANAARIVACVNACEGLADPSVVPDLLQGIRVLRSMFETARLKGGLEVAEALLAKAEGRL